MSLHRIAFKRARVRVQARNDACRRVCVRASVLQPNARARVYLRACLGALFDRAMGDYVRRLALTWTTCAASPPSRVHVATRKYVMAFVYHGASFKTFKEQSKTYYELKVDTCNCRQPKPGKC